MHISDARTTLEMAYTINKRSPDSGMWERPTHTIKRQVRKGVVYDSHLKSERRAIVSTPGQIIRATDSWVGRTSTNYRVMNALEAGKVTSAAESISEIHTQWARFCYDPMHDAKCGFIVANALFCAWLYVKKEKGVRLDKYQLYMDISMLALIEARHRFLTHLSKYTPTEMCHILGYKNMANANWHRIEPHFKEMLSILAAHNDQVIQRVYKTINAMREKEENN